MAVAGLVVARLVPAGGPIPLVIDDTLFHRRGRRVHAAYWTHDGPASTAVLGYGNRWVICAVLVTLPCCRRPVALPVAFRLWRGKGTTTPVQLAVELVGLLTAAFPDRRVDVVADAAYSSAALRALPERVSWTLRLRKNARLDGLTPARTGRPGRPRLRGDRLGTPLELAATADYTGVEVLRYGLRQQVQLAVVSCLWWEPFGTRPCRALLIREPGTTVGYDVALLTTDPTTPPEQIVTRYAARWSIEVAIFDAKQVTGAGQARNRVPRAVERTVPFALLVQTLVVLWYAGARQPRRRSGRRPHRRALVHHQTRTLLRRHARRAAPNHHRDPNYTAVTRQTQRQRNPSRPGRMGSRRTRTRGITPKVELSPNGPKWRLLQVKPHIRPRQEPTMPDQPAAHQQPELLTITEAADLLRAPVATLRYWRHCNTGPRSFRLGRRVLCRRHDLHAWIDAQHRQDAGGRP